MNLYQKLVEIRKEVINFTKDKKSFNYTYVSGSQAIAKIRAKMDELHVLLYPKIGDTINTTYDYTTDKGKECTDHIVTGDMKYVWINADNPEETLEIDWKLYGSQDDVSKAFGSALTYSERYFILKFFQAPTDELDPDAKDTSGRKLTNKLLSAAQLNRMYAIAKNAGYDKAKIDAQIKNKYGKQANELTKSEYDFICNSMQK